MTSVGLSASILYSTRKRAYGVGVVAVLAVELVLRDIILPLPASDTAIAAICLTEWVLLAALLFWWVPHVEGEDLASLALGRFHLAHLWQGALAFVLLTVLSGMWSFFLGALGLEGLRGLTPLLKGLGLPVRLLLFATGTFLEEVFYRGYLIERLARLTGRVWVGAIVSWAAFTLVHLRFFGLGATLDVAAIGAVLVALYCWKRSLWPCVLAHGLNDVLGFLLVPLMS